ncbi:MAG: biotin--[acetyl-CoA-carboxylase] ligase [Ilumatobacter sp.]
MRTVAETGSTNADVLAGLERGETLARTVLRADHQTAGRGRLDRRWDAPPGANLLASLCFASEASTPGGVSAVVRPVELTQAVGLAAVLAVDRLAPGGERSEESSRAGLKWPNDVLLGDAKLAGVLAQRSSGGEIVVGIGINIGWAPDAAACLSRDLGVDVEPAEFLDVMLTELDAHLLRCRDERQRRYVERLHTLGRTVRIQLPAGDDVVGVAEGIDDSGRLLVREATDTGSPGQVRAIDVGDIVHLRTPTIDQ